MSIPKVVANQRASWVSMTRRSPAACDTPIKVMPVPVPKVRTDDRDAGQRVVGRPLDLGGVQCVQRIQGGDDPIEGHKHPGTMSSVQCDGWLCR